MRYILIVILSFIVTSCMWGSYETNIDNIMDGTWKIEETNERLQFSANGYFVLNDTIKAIFYKVIEHDNAH